MSLREKNMFLQRKPKMFNISLVKYDWANMDTLAAEVNEVRSHNEELLNAFVKKEPLWKGQ